MAASKGSFRDFEHAGWSKEDVCANYDKYFGAVTRQSVSAHGSMDIGLPQGPNFFLFSDPAESERRLEDAGFGTVSVTTVPQIWRPSSPDEAIEAILHGSVRASATLREQNPQVWPKIRTAIWDALDAYKRGARCEVPMPAVLASAIKP